jgi:type II restriction enzyme
MRQTIIDLIFEIARQQAAFDILEEKLRPLTEEELSENIVECGILPEVFRHDSSEEKLWAKYSDILLSHSLKRLGIPAEVLRARGNSADVFGRAETYTIVGDAKTFRLSRTAKNQKDFKVKALDDWRRTDTYALLASPLSQYPNRRSQIYAQAIERNVTLVSYVHLKFLLDFYAGHSLVELWETGNRLKLTLPEADRQSSQIYWAEIDRAICSILGVGVDRLKDYKNLEIAKTKEIGNEGIAYWRGKISAYQSLPKEEAIRMLIKAEKIEEKIRTIERAVNQVFAV